MALLTLILVIGVLAVPASAAEVASGTCGENLTWVLDDTGTLTISGTGEMDGWTDLWGYEAPWFDYRNDICQVIIEEGVTSIGSYAFYECEMFSVTIPNSVIKIQDDAFTNCYSLRRVYYSGTQEQWNAISIYSLYNEDLYFADLYLNGIRPDIASGTCGEYVTWVLDDEGTLTIFGVGAMKDYSIYTFLSPWYSYSDSINNVVIEMGVTSIGEYAFYNCSSLSGITIQDSVISIGYYAFSNCSSLTSITIPDNVTSIGEYAFYNCSSLTSIAIPNGVTRIEGETFSCCSSLTSITIPDSVTSIGAYAISSCNALTSITIPDSVTSIDGCAFHNCTALTNVMIENSDTSIGAYAFWDCTGLKSVSIGDGNASINSYAFEGCTGLTSVSIGNGVTSIAPHAFFNCAALTSVTMGNGATSISYSAFYNCTSLTSITIPDSVTSIGGSAFYNCTSLTSITIPDSVTSIGDRAFYGCTSLTSITIPENVTSIGDSAFYDCTSLTSIIIPYGVTSIGSGAFYNCTSLTSITIPDSVTSIGDWAFKHCAGLTSITIPESVTTIGDQAFNNCSSLTSITIPESVTRIGYYMFQYCSSLSSITIPDNVTVICSDAFSGCSSLASITIPESVTTIGHQAFKNCSSLTSITIPESVTEIGSSAFSGCSGLASITIPESVTEIGSNAFSDCSSLASIMIPDSVTSIHSNAFNKCTGLTSIVIPASITFIDSHAFDGCSRLMDVYYEGSSSEWLDIGAPIPHAKYVHYSCTEPNSHWYTETVNATCVQAGYTYETCPCNYTRNETTPATGDHLDVDPKDYLCDICGKELEKPAIVEGVTRLAGENRLVTSELIANQLKEKMGVEKFQNIIVASGGTFADALPGSYLSAVKNAPILLTLAKDKFINQTADYIKANLKDGGTVYILGGESAVPASMEKALAGYNVQRVAGKDRFGTNLEILKTAGVKAGDEVLVCEAKGYADSLSASATGKPVLLVYKKLTAAQKEYLATLSGCKFTVVGGTSVIPENLAKEIEAYGAVTRLAGKDRLETSTMVAEKYFGSATTAVVAYGWDFPDGLCGGSLAYAMKAPLILTHSKEKLFKFTADYTVAAGLNAGYVLGGDGLVSDAATKAIFNCNEITILK